MENQPNDNMSNFLDRRRNRHLWLGVILLILGISMLAQNLNLVWLPHSLFTWPVLLIILGIFNGIKHKFRSISWLFLVLIGAYFFILQNNVFSFDMKPLTSPVVLIFLGLFFIFRRREIRAYGWFPGGNQERGGFGRQRFGRAGYGPWPNAESGQKTTEEMNDFVDINVILSGIKYIVISKSFHGGNISCNFGSALVDCSQADFTGSIILTINVSFGGVELILPSNWVLKNELTVTLGGVDDKRRGFQSPDFQKTIILQGSVICGGVDIKNY